MLDDMVKFSFEVEMNPMDVFTPAVRQELLRRAEAAEALLAATPEEREAGAGDKDKADV